MRFEFVTGSLLNMEHVVDIYPENQKDDIIKSYDDKTQMIKTEIKGEPYRIIFRLIDGRWKVLTYKKELDRDAKFRALEASLVST